MFDTILINSVFIGSDSVRICHEGYSEIIIDIDSLGSHLDHGDCFGDCDGIAPRSGQSFKVDSEKLFNVNVIPNPVNAECYIQLQGIDAETSLTVELYNYTGKKVKEIFQGSVTGRNKLPLQFKLSTKDIPSGIYLLKANQNNFIKVVKLLIQH